MSAMKTIRRWLAAGALLAGAMLAGCGGGGGSGGGGGGGGTQACTESTCGTAMLTLTDAPGDFQEYSVDLVSLRLTRANGSVVETLPASTRVDLADLIDLNEIISAGQIPAGDYVSGIVSVDYSHAEILAEDANGGSVQLAPVDANGQPITTLDLTVKLDSRNHLVITPGRVRRLAFDFDLSSSNSVDLMAGTVTVQPVLEASVMPVDTRSLRVRGLLDSVDTVAGSYVAKVLPFRVGTGTRGAITVHTDSATQWEIDGTTYTGSAGLAQLATLPAGSVTIAVGQLTTADHSYTARRVLAGSSALPLADSVRGVVRSRSGDTLVVRGAGVDFSTGMVERSRGDVTLTIGTGTRVTKEGEPGVFSTQDISVGQRIVAIGQAGGTSAARSFDASAGRVRLLITSLWGTVNSHGSGQLAVNVAAIEGRNPQIFNFAGTGTSAASDANPADYQVATGTLSLTGVNDGDVTRLFGFVTPFGSAHPDFNAITRVDYSEIRATLAVGWTLAGTATPFTALSSSGLTANLDASALGARHFVKVGPLLIDLLSLPASPPVVPDMSASASHYAIAHTASRSIDNYASFADFSAALSAALNGTVHAQGMLASGHYARVGNTFTAVQMVVVLND